jgi:hypothetical protein
MTEEPEEKHFAVLCSDGAIKIEDIVGQLRDEQWVPLAVTKPRGVENAIPTLLLFNNVEVAHKFAQRNFPKDWMISVVQLVEADHEWINKRGWKIEHITYPRIMNSHADYELTYAVLEFASKPDVMFRG